MSVTVYEKVAGGGGNYSTTGGGQESSGGSGTTITSIATYASPTFTVAGNYIVAQGPCRALSVILDTSVVGSVTVYNNTGPNGPTLLATTVTASGSNVIIPINADASTGICIVVVGNNVGRVTYREII